MKLWQLASVAGNREILERIASTRDDWADIRRWYAAFDDLVREQQRASLDFELPADYVEEVLASIGGTLYVSEDGWLRSWQLKPTDRPLSFLEGYRKYGGDALEQTLERGAIALN